MEKKCTGCGETKPLEEYHKKKSGKYGRCAKCKLCMNAYDQSEKRKAYQKAYQKAYRQSEEGKAYRKAYNKAYNQSEAGKAKRKAYSQSEAGKAADKKYKQSEAGKAAQKKYEKNRRQTDPVYKLQCNLRSGFCNWIKSNQKTCKTEQYVGCTYQELLDHLESQFEEGMTWENQGRGDNKWQIDHFKAQSRFNPTDEEEKYMCWHYTNLQPMWSSENISWKDKKKPGDEFIVWMDREIGWVNISF